MAQYKQHCQKNNHQQKEQIPYKAKSQHQNSIFIALLNGNLHIRQHAQHIAAYQKHDCQT